MEDLTCKNTLDIEKAQSLDFYYSEHICDVFKLDTEEIIQLVTSFEGILGYSLLKIELEYFVFEEAVNAEFFFNETELTKYLKCYEISKNLSFDNHIALTLGNYYFDIDKEKSVFENL